MSVLVKFVGSLRHFSSVSSIKVSLNGSRTLWNVIDDLEAQIPALKGAIIDKRLGYQKTNALILVNDREISVLKGLETALENGDEVVFIPVVHGG